MSGYRVPGAEAHLDGGTIHAFVQKPIEMQELLGHIGIRVTFGDER